MNRTNLSLKKLRFPPPFTHQHPPVQNVNEIFEDQLTVGQRTADLVANTMGSWTFIVIQSIVLSLWIMLNVAAWMNHWDPYPFILMNLVLSMQAAYAAPIIMMSQNRQSAKDRIQARNDFLINQKAEVEIRAILDHLSAQDQALTQLHQILLQLQAQVGQDSPDQPTGLTS